MELSGMRFSRLFGKTLRDTPSDADTLSHQLLLRTGMINQVAGGVYTYMPLAYRALDKIESIIREEMDAAGGQEMRMPALQPREIWQKTGRDAAFGDGLFRLKDRRARDLVLAPTHEEIVTITAKQFIQSYRDLPRLVYQVQTKFRDEARPRAGLIRVREFTMKDAYSFDRDEESLDITYQSMVGAYTNIFRRCGIPAIPVQADSGAIGGKDSQEFVLLNATGEDSILHCISCGYAANSERATSAPWVSEAESILDYDEVETPGLKSIQEITDYLGVSDDQTLKCVFYVADGKFVFVSIRGDLTVNETKLSNVLSATDLRSATEDEIRAQGLIPGYASPVGVNGLLKIGDVSINSGVNFVVGANREGYHAKNANYERDFWFDIVQDIALVEEGYPCPDCEKPLDSDRGIEVGHVFKLGTSFSSALEATYIDESGEQQLMVMGCYGIGVGRLLAASVEHNQDSKGMMLPPEIAPFQVYLIGMQMTDKSVQQKADELFDSLVDVGIEVFYDDRDESPGVKMNDGDLLGFPVRVIVSKRNITEGVVEVTLRNNGEAVKISFEEVVGAIADKLSTWKSSS